VLLESEVELRLLFGLSVSDNFDELSLEDSLDWPLKLLLELAPWLELLLGSEALCPQREELELLLEDGDWLSVELLDAALSD